jgi:Ca2+-binding EF-hand superfamily protein
MMSDWHKKKFVHLFSVLDSDKSGSLEASDFERLANNLAAGRGWKQGDENTEALVARFLAQWQMMAPFAQGGKIGKDAFLQIQEAMLGDRALWEATTRALSDFVFFALDADGDGKIGKAEHKAFFRAYGIDEKESDELFPQFDANRDGHLTQNEVYALVSQYFFNDDPKTPGNYIFGKF